MRIDARRAAIGASALVAVALTLLVVSALAPSATTPQPTAFTAGPANLQSWAGAMRDEGHEVKAVVSGLYLLGQVEDAKATLLVVPEPTRGPTAPEAEALEAFLDRGGHLFLADPSGRFNSWLAPYGIAVGSQRLLDSSATENPRIVRLEASLGVGDPRPVTTWTPGTLLLEEESAWQPWLVAPAPVHIDLGNDGSINRTDPPGPHLVGASLQTPEGGWILVTADHNWVADAFWNRDGSSNDALARDWARLILPDHGTVLVDESQHGWLSAETSPVTWVDAMQAWTGLPPWALIMALAGLLGVAALVTLRAPELQPYAAHVMRDPVTEPAIRPDASAGIREIGWEVLEARTGQPVAQLKEAGPEEAVAGLVEDPWLGRALLGKATDADRLLLMKAYLKVKGR